MRKSLYVLSPVVLALGAGCVSPAASRDVNEAQRETIAALSASYAADLAAMRDLFRRALDARRTLLIGAAHREMLVRGYLTPELGPDAARLAADLADASVESTLIGEVRTGRMTLEDATRFLNDYSLAVRMSAGDAAGEPMLARLAPVAAHDRAAAALMGSLESHTRDVARLFEDAQANAGALAEFASFEPDAGGSARRVAREVWERGVLDEIEDASERAAAERLLERILGSITEKHDG